MKIESSLPFATLPVAQTPRSLNQAEGKSSPSDRHGGPEGADE